MTYNEVLPKYRRGTWSKVAMLTPLLPTGSKAGQPEQ